MVSAAPGIEPAAQRVLLDEQRDDPGRPQVAAGLDVGQERRELGISTRGVADLGHERPGPRRDRADVGGVPMELAGRIRFGDERLRPRPLSG